MADRELRINLVFSKQAAEGEARQFHENERRRIRETSREQEKADQAYVQSVKTKLRAGKQLEDAAKRHAREEEKAIQQSEQAYVRAVKTKLRAEKQLEEEQKRRARDQARAEADSIRRQLLAEKQLLLASEMNTRRVMAEQERSEKAYVRAMKQRLRAEKQLDDQAEAEKKSARTKSLKETNEEMRRHLQELNVLEKTATESGQAAIESDRKIRQIRRKAEEQDNLRRRVSDENFALERVHKAATRSNEGQRGEIKKTTGSLRDQTSEIARVSQAYMALRFAADVGRAIDGAMKAAADSAVQARDHVKQMFDEMERFREQLAEVSAMKGMPQNAASTAEQLGFYARAGVTPQQGIEAEGEFQAQMAGMIEPAKLAPGQKASSYRMTGRQSAQLQEFAMGLAAANNMDQQSAMLLLGTVASKAKTDKEGKIDVEDVQEQFAKNFGLLQKARGHTAVDARQFAEAAQKIVGQGAGTADINQLAVMFGAQAEIGPGKTRVHLDALFRGLDQVRANEEKRDELGITDNMTDLEALQAARIAIPRIAAQEGVPERQVARRYFDDQRELDAFMADLNQGVRGGVYARISGEQAAMNAGTARARIGEYRRSSRGVAARQASEQAQANAERAATYENLVASRRQAAIQVTRDAQVEMPEALLPAIATRTGQQFGNQGTPFEQETERLNLHSIEQGLANYAEGQAWLDSHPPLTIMTPEPTKADAINLLTRLRRSGGRIGNPDWKPKSRIGGIAREQADRLVGQPARTALGAAGEAGAMIRNSLPGGGARRANVVLPGPAGMRALRSRTRGVRTRNAFGVDMAGLGVEVQGGPEAAAAAAKAAVESDAQREARLHIEANARDMAAHHAAANPAPPPPTPKPNIPEFQWGQGPIARGVAGMLRPPAPIPPRVGPAPGSHHNSGLPAPQPYSEPNAHLPGVAAAQGWAQRWWRGDYATRGDEGTNALGILFKRILPAVPPALPGRPVNQGR